MVRTGAGVLEAPVSSSPDKPSGDAAKRDAELASKVAAFVDAFINTGPVFTRDGKGLLFVSAREGLPQLYTATPSGPARRVVATTQRVSDLFAAPGGKDVVFLSDTGADENWSLFRVGIDGKNLIELTPNLKLSRNRAHIPDGRPSLLFFSARKMAEAKSTIYSISATAPSEPKAIYSDDKPAYLEDVSADGKVGLVRRMIVRSDQSVLRLDLETGNATPVYPSDTKVTIYDLAISRDGKLAYIATDNGEEQALVLVIDLKTGKQIAKRAFAPATAKIAKIVLAKETRLLAVTIDAGNRSEIQLVDARTLADRFKVALPAGSGVASKFSEDGKQLVATWSTPESPNDLYVIDTKTGKVEGRKEPRPSLPDVKIDIVSADVPAFDGGKIPVHAFVPRGEQGKKHPVIVSFHGGPVGTSMLRWSGSTAFFVSLGYVVVEPNVRGSAGYGRAFEAADNGAKRVDAFRDVELSARWAASQPWADKDRMVVHGASYGGYTTLIALSRWPELWRAGVDMFGVANLETTLTTTSGAIRQILSLEFGDVEKDRELLKSLSPIHDVDKIVDPVFVYAGANDPRVPRSESDMIVRALRAKKVPTEYMVADDEGHSVARRHTQLELLSRMARFLETHLR